MHPPTTTAASTISEAVVSLALFRDDRDLFEIGLSLWADTHDHYLKWGQGGYGEMGITSPDSGPSKVLFTSAGTSPFLLQRVWLAMPSVVTPRERGETTETLRDLVHAQFGLAGLLQVAELAWQQVSAGEAGG